MSSDKREMIIIDLFNKIKLTQEELKELFKSLYSLNLQYNEIIKTRKFYKKYFDENVEIISGINRYDSRYQTLSKPYEIEQLIIERKNKAFGDTASAESLKHYLLTKDILEEDLEYSKIEVQELEKEMEKQNNMFFVNDEVYKNLKRNIKKVKRDINNKKLYLSYLTLLRKYYSSIDDFEYKRRTR